MTAAEYASVFDGLVGEITQHYPRGRVLVAVDGADEQATRPFADLLAGAMKASSWRVLRSTSTPGAGADSHDLSFPRHDRYRDNEDYSRLRDIVSRFREGSLVTEASALKVLTGAVLVVDGPFLLRPELRGAWHFGIWLEGDMHLSEESLEAQVRYTRDGAPRAAADAIFDVTDQQSPARVWADSC